MKKAIILASVLYMPFQASANEPSVRSDLVKSASAPRQLYTFFETRHHYDTYYDEDGYIDRRTPTWHGRLLLGMSFYEGAMDVYGVLGFYKETKTQQIRQHRPEISVDLKPHVNEWSKLIIYNTVQLPFEEDSDVKQEPLPNDQQGAIYTLGINPQFFYDMVAGAFRLKPSLGVDLWTNWYSRKQKIAVPEDDNFEPRKRESFSLIAEDAPEGEEFVEDYGQYYFGEAKFAVGASPLIIPSLTTEVGAYHNNEYYPKYFRKDGELDFDYGAKRTTYLRARLSYKFSEMTSFVNDFYVFYQNGFERLQVGEDRRLRNISRLIWKL